MPWSKRNDVKQSIAKATRVPAIVLMVLFGSGCDERPSPTSSRGGSTAEDHQPAQSAWQHNTVTILDDKVVAAIAAAMAEARSTADAARIRFQESLPSDREKWWIKWEVPLPDSDDSSTDGGTATNEYLWVRPVQWSQFRVEGLLASEPRQAISYGKPGDLVSFPISELADWVYLLNGSMSGARQGGYTIDVLEDHFGVPEPGGDDR